MQFPRFSPFFLAVLGLVAACGISPAEQFSPEIPISSAADSLELFAPGIISTPRNERDLAISPDGLEIYYTLSSPDNLVRAIVQIVQENGQWQPPQVASFSGSHGDIEPFFAPGGKRLYFSSNRPVNETDGSVDYDIWYVDRTETGWGAPQNLGPPVNTPEDEFYPSVAANGNIYFTAAYENSKGTEDIYLSVFQDGQYLDPVSLDTAINTKKYEFNAYVSPAEDLIVFSSYGRPDDLGGGDLYYSEKGDNGQWMPARHMENGINSPKLDYCPFVDDKSRNFYFSSSRRAPRSGESALVMEDLIRECEGIENGLGNIYRVGFADAFDKN
ncbi:MAG: PD40 domain-containing protein [Saprospirales bacterium]|nr:PD40 domain-containing protein [Saprospirales bacterium]